MQNYQIYSQIGQGGTHSTCYTGRKKKTIDYFAITSFDKSQRERVLHSVQFLRSVCNSHVSKTALISPATIRFFNWYETTNHLWLVTELCTGGTLADCIGALRPSPLQMKHGAQIPSPFLPDITLWSYARDLITSLRVLHSQGIVYGELKPSNVLIDDEATLKLYDFSRAFAVSPAHLQQQQQSATAAAAATANVSGGASAQPTAAAGGVTAQQQQQPPPGGPLGSFPYSVFTAPELLVSDAPPSFASDLFSLGAMLFVLATGRTPCHAAASGVIDAARGHDNDGDDEEGRDCESNRRAPGAAAGRGMRADTTEDEYQKLLQSSIPTNLSEFIRGVMHPDPLRRWDWSAVLASGFMRVDLNNSVSINNINNGEAVAGATATLTDTLQAMPLPEQVFFNIWRQSYAAKLKQKKTMTTDGSTSQVQHQQLNESGIGASASASLSLTASGFHRFGNAASEQQYHKQHHQLQLQQRFDAEGSATADSITLVDVIVAASASSASSSEIKPIVHNHRIERILESKVEVAELVSLLQSPAAAPIAVAFESSLLSTLVLGGAAALGKASGEQLQEVLARTFNTLCSAHTSISDKQNLLCYLETVCSDTVVANTVVNSTILDVLLTILSMGNIPIAMTVLVITTIARLFRFATFIHPDALFPPLAASALASASASCVGTLDGKGKIIVSTLMGFSDPATAPVKIRRRALAALGELVFYCTSQSAFEDAASRSSLSLFSPATFQRICDGIVDTQDEICRHYCVKIVENVMLAVVPLAYNSSSNNALPPAGRAATQLLMQLADEHKVMQKLAVTFYNKDGSVRNEHVRLSALNAACRLSIVRPDLVRDQLLSLSAGGSVAAFLSQAFRSSSTRFLQVALIFVGLHLARGIFLLQRPPPTAAAVSTLASPLFALPPPLVGNDSVSTPMSSADPRDREQQHQLVQHQALLAAALASPAAEPLAALVDGLCRSLEHQQHSVKAKALACIALLCDCCTARFLLVGQESQGLLPQRAIQQIAQMAATTSIVGRRRMLPSAAAAVGDSPDDARVASVAATQVTLQLRAVAEREVACVHLQSQQLRQVIFNRLLVFAAAGHFSSPLLDGGSLMRCMTEALRVATSATSDHGVKQLLWLLLETSDVDFSLATIHDVSPLAVVCLNELMITSAPPPAESCRDAALRVLVNAVFSVPAAVPEIVAASEKQLVPAFKSGGLLSRLLAQHAPLPTLACRFVSVLLSQQQRQGFAKDLAEAIIAAADAPVNRLIALVCNRSMTASAASSLLASLTRCTAPDVSFLLSGIRRAAAQRAVSSSDLAMFVGFVSTPLRHALSEQFDYQSVIQQAADPLVELTTCVFSSLRQTAQKQAAAANSKSNKIYSSEEEASALATMATELLLPYISLGLSVSSSAGAPHPQPQTRQQQTELTTTLEQQQQQHQLQHMAGGGVTFVSRCVECLRMICDDGGSGMSRRVFNSVDARSILIQAVCSTSSTSTDCLSLVQLLLVVLTESDLDAANKFLQDELLILRLQRLADDDASSAAVVSHCRAVLAICG